MYLYFHNRIERKKGLILLKVSKLFEKKVYWG